MKKLIFALFIIQFILAEDVKIWISNVTDNSVSVSMESSTDIVGFQLRIDVLDFTGDLFAPIDSSFSNEKIPLNPSKASFLKI